MRKYTIILTIILAVVLAGCNKEYVKPEVKRQDPEVVKSDIEFTDADGTMKDPAYHTETLFVSGEMYKNKNETFLGEFGIEVDRLYRGDAAKYRLPNEFVDKKLDKDQEWMMVTLNVYNFYEDETQPLYFNKGDITIYNSKGKPYTVHEIGSEKLPENVIVYKGRVEQVILPVIVKKKSNKFYVGIDKLVREFKLEDLDEDGNLIEDEIEFEIEGEEEEESKDKKDGNKEDKKKDKEPKEESLIRYISLEEKEPIREFYPEDEERDEERVEFEEEDKDKSDKKGDKK